MITDTQLTRKRMVAGQIFTNRVHDNNVLTAMEIIPRENFAPENYERNAYLDDPIPLGNGRYLLDPLTIARILQAAEIRKNNEVLIVDCELGYLAALVSILANKVVAVEEDVELARRAKNNLSNIKITNVEVVSKTPARLFDIIIINGAVEIIPESLLSLLVEGGKLVAIENGFIKILRKHGKSFSESKVEQAFVQILPEFKKPKKFVF